MCGLKSFAVTGIRALLCSRLITTPCSPLELISKNTSKMERKYYIYIAPQGRWSGCNLFGKWRWQLGDYPTTLWGFLMWWGDE